MLNAVLRRSVRFISLTKFHLISGMPFALHEAGFGVGVLLILTVAYVTDRSLVLLIAGGRVASVSSYQELVEAAFGKPGYLLCSMLQFLYPFICKENNATDWSNTYITILQIYRYNNITDRQI